MTRKPHRARRSGMTMIELITALVLFAIIFGVLMIVLRSATRLWIPDQSQQQEQAVGDAVTDILASDFYQAFADNGVLADGSTSDNPCFWLDCNTNALASAADRPQVVLYFARHASPRTTGFGSSYDRRASLDAVFYVCYSNCLSRHVFPIYHDEWSAAPSLSEVLLGWKTALESEATALYGWFRTGGEAPVEGLHSLLAERCEFAALAILPPAPEVMKDPPDTAEPLIAVDTCEAYEIPDFLDVGFILYSEADWRERNALLTDASPETDMRRAHLGKQFSKRIAFPAKGGSRL